MPPENRKEMHPVRSSPSSYMVATLPLLVAMASGCESSTSAEAGTGNETAASAEDNAQKQRQSSPPARKRAPSVVTLSADALARTEIRTVEMSRGNLKDTAFAPATVKHDVARVAHITPLAQGQIVELHATLGDEVEAGQALAVIRSVALGEARAVLSETKASREVARANFQRQKKLRREGIASEREFLEAKGALRKADARYQSAVAKLRTFGVRGGQGARYPLRSQIGGTIIEQHAALGETKGPGDALFVVADQSKLWVIGRVYERDVSKVQLGMKAQVRLDAYPDRTWKGAVDWMAGTVDEKTRALPVRVVLDNEKGLLKPGLFGTLVLSPASGPEAPILVPVDAVQELDGTDVVFVPGQKQGHFRAVEVELGAEAGRLVEITEGLEAGQKVVTKGAFDLEATLTASTTP